MQRRVIFFELNEVPWRIVDEYVQSHPDSHLARILPTSRQYTSMTADRGHLSPWTTWPTVHRGVNNEHHLIGAFGQDRTEVDKEYPPLWEMLRGHGVSVGICGTLHTHPTPPDIEAYSFFLPDTFASDSRAFPDELETFQAFNLKMARESARNVDTGVPLGDALKVLRKSPAIGIRPATYAALAAQLVAERRKPWLSTRRRTFQAVLAFDLFMKQLAQRRPSFSSFFSNHVASAMHRYWAASYPQDYQDLGLGADWMDKYRDEVPWAMDQADAMIGRLAKFCEDRPEFQLWIVSSMGQGATKAQPLETQLYLNDVAAFAAALGLPHDHGWEIRPAMLPQRNVRIDQQYVEQFEAGLRSITIGANPLTYKRDGEFFSVDFGQANLHNQPDALQVHGQTRSLSDYGLQIVEIEDRSDTTAYHIPQGILCVFDPQDLTAKSVTRPEVSVLQIAPTLLEYFALTPPEYMQRPTELTEVFSPL
ncbi:MAG: hypothetical protein ABI137_07325 [Antricoccus sp.]